MRPLVVLSLLFLTGCASIGKPKTAEVSKVSDLDGVLSLMGRSSMAQACPISPNKALTNAHVIRDHEGFTSVAPYIWEALGKLGLLGGYSTTEWDKFRDLAYVHSNEGSTFPRWYDIAKEGPRPGDRVRFRGWDFRKRRDAFAPREFEATVLRTVNGHLLYYPPGVPGTSGSCVLNDGGQVVAINAFGKDLEDRQAVGGAVGIWGELLDLGKPVEQ